jgi:hypothetical protein
MPIDISDDALFKDCSLILTISAHKERGMPVAALSEQVPDRIIE